MLKHPDKPAFLLSILLLAAACYEKDDYDITPGVVETRLVLQSRSGANTLPADGFSRLGLVAKISPEADASRRTVVFTTSAGELVGGTSTSTTSTKVVADASGEAFVQLQSSNKVEIAVVTAAVEGVPGLTTNMTVAFVAIQPDDLIQFTSVPSGNLPADGATLTPITVLVSGSIPPANRSVVFSTSAGSFAPTTGTPAGGSVVSVPVDAGNTATVLLKSASELTTALIQATINGVTRNVTVSFQRARPNFASLIADKLTVTADATDQINLTATFKRNVGDVTVNTPVIWEAKDEDGDLLPASVLQNVSLTNAEGVATAVFRPGTSTPPGKVTITAHTEGSEIEGKVQVTVKAPTSET
jgi:hypothetical protein